MTKVLVLYYSSYGHIERMADAVAEGVRQAGADAVIKRVPELVPEDVARMSHFKLDQKAPVATVAELADYDAIIAGAPATPWTRMASAFANNAVAAGKAADRDPDFGRLGARAADMLAVLRESVEAARRIA